MIEPDTPWTAMFLLVTAVVIAIEALLIPMSIAFEIEPSPSYSVAVFLIFTVFLTKPDPLKTLAGAIDSACWQKYDASARAPHF